MRRKIFNLFLLLILSFIPPFVSHYDFKAEAATVQATASTAINQNQVTASTAIQTARTKQITAASNAQSSILTKIYAGISLIFSIIALTTILLWIFLFLAIKSIRIWIKQNSSYSNDLPIRNKLK